MSLKYWAMLLWSIALSPIVGQQTFTGTVQGIESGEVVPLIGASIRWQEAGIGTVSDEEGNFTIPASAEQDDALIVSYTGYKSDTLQGYLGQDIEVYLEATIDLTEVNVTYRKKATEISFLDPMKVEQISEEELLKAACCNLSESFETNASVDVSFTDAITGARQIRMLGLRSKYSTITRENIPFLRGLNTVQGFEYIPGTWIESMQLTKGTGSVVNGYESIAGQINVELRKPEKPEALFVNVYANEGGRFEGNVHSSRSLKSSNWSTALLLHAKRNALENDRNDDGFLDNPLSTHFFALNRWKYADKKGNHLQFGFQGTYIDNEAGQIQESDLDRNDAIWTAQLKTTQFDGWAKYGKVFEHMPWKSYAIQLSGSLHHEDNQFGIRQYIGDQHSLYANFLYQSILSNTYHKFTTGLSFQLDSYDEDFIDQSFSFTERVLGAFFEYSFVPSEKFTLVAGLRGDYHNIYGGFLTPRLHLRYSPLSDLVLRASGGRGQRTGLAIAENLHLLGSSRQWFLPSPDGDLPYGLEPEVAWNYGVNITKGFRVAGRDLLFTADYYVTDFQNQMIVDLDRNPQDVHIYNLEGDSYSKSLQLQLDVELVERLDVRSAYRRFDVKSTFSGELLQLPLVARDRLFMNLSYATESQWFLDYTINWISEKRIPSTQSNPEIYRLESTSPDFWLSNAQVRKVMGKFDVYLGVENLFDFRQSNPILASEEPFGDFFDSSLVWGPIFGRNVYAGFRFHL